MEVVEVGVAAVGLPALLTAVLVASVHSDGVQRVGLSVVVANPCSAPEWRETSVSYRHPSVTSRMGGNEGGTDGDEIRKQVENREENRKVWACLKCERRKSNQNKECRAEHHPEMVEESRKN